MVLSSVDSGVRGNLNVPFKLFIEAYRRTSPAICRGISMISFEEFILEDTGPIYLQIIRYVKQGIASGTIGDREEIPSRRALSALLGVNPNTIQKAYHLLEEEGVINSRSGAKSYTCVNHETVTRIRQELLENDTAGWVRAMKQLGIEKTEAIRLAESIWSE